MKRTRRPHAGYSRQAWREKRGLPIDEKAKVPRARPYDHMPRDDEAILTDFLEQLEGIWRRWREWSL